MRRALVLAAVLIVIGVVAPARASAQCHYPGGGHRYYPSHHGHYFHHYDPYRHHYFHHHHYPRFYVRGHYHRRRW